MSEEAEFSLDVGFQRGHQLRPEAPWDIRWRASRGHPIDWRRWARPVLVSSIARVSIELADAIVTFEYTGYLPAQSIEGVIELMDSSGYHAEAAEVRKKVGEIGKGF